MGHCGTEDKSITVLLSPVQFNTVQLNPVQLCPVQFRAFVGFHNKPFRNTGAHPIMDQLESVHKVSARVPEKARNRAAGTKNRQIGAEGAEKFEKWPPKNRIFGRKFWAMSK